MVFGYSYGIRVGLVLRTPLLGLLFLDIFRGINR